MMNERECQIQKSLAEFGNMNFSREERYLKIFARDFESFISSADYLKEKDTESQYYFDFLISFEDLLAKMKEFRWSAEKLLENGIDFKSLRKLYFAVA